MSTIDFSHLKLLAVFATVVETQSFAAASRHLHTSRSRVSEQVSQLELALGVRLLQRSTRQLLVTREGSEVYEQARRLPDVLSSIESSLTPGEAKGRVAITMNHDIAHKIILPVLDEFQKQHPQIHLDFILNDEVSNLIAEQIDLGIRIGLPNDSSLIGRVLHEESLGIYASSSYLKKAGTPKTAEQLAQCRWVLLPQLEYENKLRFRSKKKTIDIKPESYERCNSPFMIQKMVESGLGVGALLPSLVKNEVESKTLVRLMPSWSTERLIFSLVYPSRQNIPRRTRVLIDFLIEAKIFT